MKRTTLILFFLLFSTAFACFSMPEFGGEGGEDEDPEEDELPDYQDYEKSEPKDTDEDYETTTMDPDADDQEPTSSEEREIKALKAEIERNQPWIEMIPCIFLSCTFERGTMCMYRNLGPPAEPEKDGPSASGKPSEYDYSETKDEIMALPKRAERPRDRPRGNGDRPRVNGDRPRTNGDKPETEDVDEEPIMYPDEPEEEDPGEEDYAFNPDDEDENFDPDWYEFEDERKKRRRTKRLPSQAYSWSAVSGRFGNRVTGIRQADEGSYYAAAYIRASQKAAFEARVLRLSEDVLIEFSYYEAVAGMKMEVCCESLTPPKYNCSFESGEKVLAKQFHAWFDGSARCSAGTERIVFICSNHSKHQGACAVDDIRVSGEDCPHLTAKENEIDFRRRRKQRRRFRGRRRRRQRFT